MGILSFGRTLRSSQRLANILTVLARHGFGHLAVRLRLERFVPFRQKLSRRLGVGEAGPEDLSNIAHRAARALEDLGPTFIKLGQALAARPDLLPAEFQSAFRRLQDKVRPFPFDQVRQTVQVDLGEPLEKLFRSFDEPPFACGSIGQVHYATTVEGLSVVVKVKRPGIERTVMNDVALLRTLAKLIERHMPEYRIYRPALLVDEFARTLTRELDFVNEASITARFSEAFADDLHIRTPQVFWELSSHNILTLERLEGLTVSPETDFEAAGLDRRRLAHNLLEAFFKQFFELGLFHADPHPGNLLAQAPESWGIIDFGQVGRLDADLRSRLAMGLTAAVNRQFDLVIDILDDLGTLPEDADHGQLKNDLAALLDKYYGTPIKRIRIGSLFEEVVAVARQHRVILPRDFIMLGKSLASIGGVALMLDPDCAPLEFIKPRLNRLLVEKMSPRNLAGALGLNVYHLATLAQQAPQMLRTIARNLMRGQMRLIFRHDGLDNFINELDRASNRIAFSVVTAAIILGSSVILLAKVGPKWGEVAYLGLVGFVVAAVAGLWLLISIFRSGRL